jgi:hypothetical protein
VRKFSGDPAATDSTRVLRLPNFANRKYETECVVKVRAVATQTYHLEDFRLRTPPMATATSRPRMEADKAVLVAT